jgi:signal transduction histidine kinase
LHDVLDELRSQFSDKGLEMLYPDVANIELAITPEVLTMALYNLLENSLQHQAKQVEITANHGSKVFDLKLHDNGSGISPANQDKIFTPFFTTRRSAGGTGLGLAITISLLKAYQGKVELLPSNRGALFLITLQLINFD